MATIKSINVAVRATTGDLETNMKKAGGIVDDFGTKKLKLSKAAKMLGSELGGVGGAVGGMATQLIAFGPVVGGISAGIGMLTMALEGNKEITEAVTKAQEGLVAIREKMSKVFGADTEEGPYTKGSLELLKQTRLEMDALRAKQNDLKNPFGDQDALAGAIEKSYRKEYDALQAQIDARQQIVNEIKNQTASYDPLNAAQQKYNEGLFAAKAMFPKGSVEQLNAQLGVTLNLEDALFDKMDHLQKGTQRYVEVQKELRDTYLKVNDLMAEIEQKSIAIVTEGAKNQAAESLFHDMFSFDEKSGFVTQNFNEGSVDAYMSKLDALAQLEEDLTDIQSTLIQGSAEWNQNVADQQQTIRDIYKTMDQFDAAIDSAQGRLQDIFDGSQVSSFRRQIEQLQKDLENGFIDPEDFKNATEKLFSDQKEALTDKIDKKRGGVAKQIDTHLIDVRGLAMGGTHKQEVEVRQIEKTNQILKAMEQIMKDKLGTAIAG